MTPDILRLLILAAVFAAVLLGAEAAISYWRSARGETRAMNKRMQLIARGYSRDQVMASLRRTTNVNNVGMPWPLDGLARRMEQALSGAGLRISSARILLYLLLLMVALFIAVLLLMYVSGTLLNVGRLLLIACFAAAMGFGLPMAILSRLADRRRKQLAEQFPIALDVFVRGLRAGHPVTAALELLTTEMTDPIGSEFGLAVDEVTYGADVRDALQDMADRCGVEDMQMFVVSLTVQAETGGNLAEILENLAQVIRDRANMMLKVRALSSEGRMTALILTFLPVVAFSMVFMTGPSFYFEVADDPLFIPGFSALLLAWVIGVYWIRRLIDLKV